MTHVVEIRGKDLGTDGLFNFFTTTPVTVTPGYTIQPMHTLGLWMDPATGLPLEPAREKMCIDTITQVNLSNNVYTVSGDPATGLDGLRNNGPSNLTVTIADSVKTMTKILKPGDVYSQNFTGFTTITFSANAEFEADILR